MPSEEIMSLYKLGKLDSEIYSVRKKASSLDPGNKIVEEIRLAQTEWNIDQSNLDKTNARIYELESEIFKISEKIKKDKITLYESGNVTSREAQVLEKDLLVQEKRVEDLEHEYLNLLDEKPPLGVKANIKKEKLNRLRIKLDQHQKEVKIEQNKLKEKFDILIKSRSDYIKEVNPAVLIIYEKIRKKNGDTGISEINKDRACHECGHFVAEKILDSIRSGNIVQCESCSRILCEIVSAGVF